MYVLSTIYYCNKNTEMKNADGVEKQEDEVVTAAAATVVIVVEFTIENLCKPLVSK